MVALAVRDFGQTPVECAARSTLFKAQAALGSNRLIAAGYYLCAAVRQFLESQCKYWRVTPAKKRHRQMPGEMVRALVAAGYLGANISGWMEEIVSCEDTLAHCGEVSSPAIANAISVMHSFLDASPYLVEPKTGGRS